MSKRKASTVRLVRSDGRRTALDVYEALRDSILAGRIKPGDYLSQVEVARDLGVSRTPVREALRRLHESGLIAGEPNFRSRVVGLNADEVEALYVKRVMLEGFAALCTASSASGSQLGELRQGLSALSILVESAESDWVLARTHVHTLIAIGAGVATCKEIALLLQRSVSFEQGMPGDPRTDERTADLAVYKSIVDAIARANAARTTALLAPLIGRHARSVLQMFSPKSNPLGLARAVRFIAAYEQLDADALSPPPSEAAIGRIDTALAAYLPSPASEAATEPAGAALRGRPRDASKREAILVAANALFLKYGPDAVTMNRLAEEANVAKATLYSHFPDKDAVLEGWVRRESEMMVSDSWRSDHSGATLAESLTDFGQHMLTFLAQPQHLGLERLVYGIASRDPILGERLFQAGPARIMVVLKALLIEGQASGDLAFVNLEDAANDLVGLWQGFLPVDLSFHQPPEPKALYLRERAARGVQQFMRLYGTKH